MPATKNLTSYKFGRLTVVSQTDNVDRSGSRPRGYVAWKCLCDCGVEVVVKAINLRRQHTRSCGCLQKEFVATLNKGTHGLYRANFIAEHGYSAFSRLNLYNLTSEQFNDLVVQQEGVCAICKQKPDNWHVDHDHACCPSGKSCGKCIRGLLCSNCNTGLGLFKDDVDRLKNAIVYLNES